MFVRKKTDNKNKKKVNPEQPYSFSLPVSIPPVSSHLVSSPPISTSQTKTLHPPAPFTFNFLRAVENIILSYLHPIECKKISESSAFASALNLRAYLKIPA